VMPVNDQPAPPPSPPAIAAPEGFALFDALDEAEAAEAPPDMEARSRARAEAFEAWVAEAQLRRMPLRFTWRMDRDGRIIVDSNAFAALTGARTTAAFDHPFRETAENLQLDPDGRIAAALETRDTWSGLALDWPVDDGSALPVELSGLPVYDGARNFNGYRGFGICRDFDAVAEVAKLRLGELSRKAAPTEETSVDAPPPPDDAATASTQDTPAETAPEAPEDATGNVVLFRAPGDTKPITLTPVENSAFHELARQLSARLEIENGNDAPASASLEPVFAPSPVAALPEAASEPPEWLAQPDAPARGEAARDKALFDLLPVGVLIYRLDRLLYANAAFLAQIGYPSLHALEDAGGLDALYVETGAPNTSSTSDAGKPVRISASAPVEGDAPSAAAEARLHTISWDGDAALALIFACTRPEAASVPAPGEPAAVPDAGQANAEELAAILDTTADGVVTFDADGNIKTANRSAEALFGRDGSEIVQRNLSDLFASESRHAVFDYLASIKAAGVASLLDHGREMLGRESKGGIIPLSMTIGRTRADGQTFFAVFRDLSEAKKTESELREARRATERTANAKADVLARISHEVRTPLNAIIGFSEVMIGERFGALGNERYREYVKDIRASGERVIAIVNDLSDLSRIETGKLDLAFTDQNLNEMVESCVAVMQPQANRERIIIRTSLAHALPSVVADARALRQIALNLIGNSIHLARAGGQVIVSTALSDFGEVMLRVRDTGNGLNDNEVAATLEPFRTPAPSDQSENAAVSLSLTKALVEANRAKFQIRTGGRSGTLIEIVFPHAVARA
ncbi:MAG: PAS domain S-box protein, partial [Bradyrhizobium sp.]